METKTIDNLLNELNNVQLERESMKCINGGDAWDTNFTKVTSTGTLYHWIDSDGIHHLVLGDMYKGKVMLPDELESGDR